ncbi:MAG TPA: chemotaxis protein CheX [Negativicutes bacterium]|nr:chemotaxis protein CheX [Negativicutes bacterium]
MDVNVINPLLAAFVNVLPQIGFQTVKKEALSLANTVVENDGVMINIGVTGPLKGVIIIGMDVESSKRFASKMMMGMDVPELDGLAQSAISEMGNMVCANACSHFSTAGITGLDISPPIMMLGKGGLVRLPVPQVIVIGLVVDDINVTVYVGLN